MLDAPLALAFTAGTLAAFNPCGFAMLPAYLGFFAGSQEGATGGSMRAVARALRASLVVSAGFALVFAAAGLLVVQASVAVSGYVPWLTIAIGIALIPIGIALVRGYKIPVRLPFLSRGGRGRGLGSMLLFGASYGTVSLTCTLAPFLAAVSTTFGRGGVVSGLAVFVAYAAGMASVIVVLTVALALAHGGVVARMRRVLRHVNKLVGALLVLTGAYVAYYGYYDLAITGGRNAAQGPVAWISAASATVSNWINRTGALRIAGITVGVIGLIVIASGSLRGFKRFPSRHPSDSPIGHAGKEGSIQTPARDGNSDGQTAIATPNVTSVEPATRVTPTP